MCDFVESVSRVARRGDDTPHPPLVLMNENWSSPTAREVASRELANELASSRGAGEDQVPWSANC